MYSLYYTILWTAGSRKCAYYILLILLLYDLGARIQVVAGRHCTMMMLNPKGLTDTPKWVIFLGGEGLRPSQYIEL